MAGASGDPAEAGLSHEAGGSCPLRPALRFLQVSTPGSPDTSLELHEVSSPPSGRTYAVIPATRFHGDFPALLAPS